MKLGLLGFTGNKITDRTANLGIYRPESNEHIQSFNGGPECYVQVGISTVLNTPPNIDIAGLFIGGDYGEYAFVYDRTSRKVHRYNLSTPWDITTLNRDDVVSSQDLNAYLIQRSTQPDIAKTLINPIFRQSEFGTNVLNQQTKKKYYDLLNGQGIRFSPDGTKMHILDGNDAYCKIVQFTLETAWDISSASFPLCNSPSSLPPIFWTVTGAAFYLPYRHDDRDFCFSEDGKNLYVLGKIRKYTENVPDGEFIEQVTRFELKSGRTPFDIGSFTPPTLNTGVILNFTSMFSANQNTANYTYKGQIYTNTSYEGVSEMSGMCINKNCDKMYFIGVNRAVLYAIPYSNSTEVDQYLPTLSKLDTIDSTTGNRSYVGFFNGGEQEPQGVFLNTIHNNMDFYIVGNGSKRIYQYKLVLK